MKPRRNHIQTPPRRSRILRLGFIFAVVLVASCGKKGPLYLPDTDKPPAASGGQTVAPAPTQPGKQ